MYRVKFRIFAPAVDFLSLNITLFGFSGQEKDRAGSQII